MLILTTGERYSGGPVKETVETEAAELSGERLEFVFGFLYGFMS